MSIVKLSFNDEIRRVRGAAPDLLEDLSEIACTLFDLNSFSISYVQEGSEIRIADQKIYENAVKWANEANKGILKLTL